MDDLVVFLKARLADDDEMATWVSPGRTTVALSEGDVIEVEQPARMLAEIAAKRRIVRLLQQYEAAIQQESAVARLEDPIPDNLYAARDALREAVRLLALPYVDHPDYNAAWRL